LRRSVNAISCSRSKSLNANCAFGLPLIKASPRATLHDRLQERIMVQL